MTQEASARGEEHRLGPGPGRTILLVEDDPLQLQRMALELESMGHFLFTARNGAEALLLLKEVRVDGIVSDCLMPLVDGYQLCRLVKDDPLLAELPFVLLTGAPLRPSALWAAVCGADVFLLKSEFPKGLASHVEGWPRRSQEAEPRSPLEFHPDIQAIQGQLGRSLERRLLESGLRQAIHRLCSQAADPEQLVWSFLDLIKDIIFPGVAYVAWPGQQGEHLFVLETSHLPPEPRETLESLMRPPGRSIHSIDRRESPCAWSLPAAWACAEFTMPSLDGFQPRWGVLTDPGILKAEGGLLALARAEAGLVFQNIHSHHLLLRSNAELRRSDLERSELLRVLAHEIRSPITAVQLFMDTLDEQFQGRLTPKEASRLAHTHESVQTLLDLIHSVLELERSSPRRPLSDVLELDIVAIARSMQASLAILGKSKNVGVRMEVDPSAEGSAGLALGAPDRLVRALVNLVSNAIKFSPRDGEVVVRISRVDEVIRVAILDQGPGVPESFQSELFKPFHQADAGQGGSGLGLSITRTMIEAMGGQVGVIVDDPTGGHFWFQLPACEGLP